MDNLPIKRSNKRFFRTPWGYLILTVVLIASALCAWRFGSAEMSHGAFFGALFRMEGHETDVLILYSLRLPRVLAGILAGAALSASGVMLQCVTDNGLSSPNVIGVNAGAGFGVVCALMLLPAGCRWLTLSALPAFAIIGAFLSTLVVLLISAKNGGTRASVVLSGIAVTALLNALISGATLIDTDLLVSYNAFSVGGFAGVTMRELIAPALLTLVCFVVCMCLGERLDLLALGTGMASVMGVRVRVLRMVAILCAAAMAASAVSFAGLLGFVGLIVPHAARALVGNRVRYLLPTAALLGGSLCVLADLFGRMVLSPTEIPVGITMALVGAPFFLFLLLRRGGRKE